MGQLWHKEQTTNRQGPAQCSLQFVECSNATVIFCIMQPFHDAFDCAVCVRYKLWLVSAGMVNHWKGFRRLDCSMCCQQVLPVENIAAESTRLQPWCSLETIYGMQSTVIRQDCPQYCPYVYGAPRLRAQVNADACHWHVHSCTVEEQQLQKSCY